MPSPQSLDSLSLREKLCALPPHFTSPSLPLCSPSFTFSGAVKTSKLIKVGKSPFHFLLISEDKPSNSAQVVHFCQEREVEDETEGDREEEDEEGENGLSSCL